MVWWGLWPVHPPPYISFFVSFIFNVWEVKRLAASQTSNCFSPADIDSLLVITKYDIERYDVITLLFQWQIDAFIFVHSLFTSCFWYWYNYIYSRSYECSFYNFTSFMSAIFFVYFQFYQWQHTVFYLISFSFPRTLCIGFSSLIRHHHHNCLFNFIQMIQTIFVMYLCISFFYFLYFLTYYYYYFDCIIPNY